MRRFLVQTRSLKGISRGTQSRAVESRAWLIHLFFLLYGGGYTVYQADRLILQGPFSLGQSKEVFDAEAEAALRGAQAALDYPTSCFATDLWVFLDNIEVAARLLSPSISSSQALFSSFLSLATA